LFIHNKLKKSAAKKKPIASNNDNLFVSKAAVSYLAALQQAFQMGPDLYVCTNKGAPQKSLRDVGYLPVRSHLEHNGY